MNERIRVQFSRAGLDLPVSKLSDEGLVFAFETSAKPLGFGIGSVPDNEIVARKMSDVRRNEDWAPEVFKLKVTRDGDGLVISGGGTRDQAKSLPPGRFRLHFRVSETRFKNGVAPVDIPENGEARVTLQEDGPSHRLTLAELAQWDGETRAICEHAASRIDGMDPIGWLNQSQPRLARKACLLNLLAKARSLPSARPGESFCADIQSIHWVDTDRVAITPRPGLLDKLKTLPGWRDSGPVHPSHARTLARLFGGEPADYRVESFREPAAVRSLQVVCATHKSTGKVVAELDIDLGNPGFDLSGLFVHIGELVDPGRTNHLGLFDEFASGVSSDFLYYKLERV